MSSVRNYLVDDVWVLIQQYTGPDKRWVEDPDLEPLTRKLDYDLFFRTVPRFLHIKRSRLQFNDFNYFPNTQTLCGIVEGNQPRRWLAIDILNPNKRYQSNIAEAPIYVYPNSTGVHHHAADHVLHHFAIDRSARREVAVALEEETNDFAIVKNSPWPELGETNFAHWIAIKFFTNAILFYDPKTKIYYKLKHGELIPHTLRPELLEFHKDLLVLNIFKVDGWYVTSFSLKTGTKLVEIPVEKSFKGKDTRYLITSEELLVNSEDVLQRHDLRTGEMIQRIETPEPFPFNENTFFLNGSLITCISGPGDVRFDFYNLNGVKINTVKQRVNPKESQIISFPDGDYLFVAWNSDWQSKVACYSNLGEMITTFDLPFEVCEMDLKGHCLVCKSMKGRFAILDPRLPLHQGRSRPFSLVKTNGHKRQRVNRE